MSLAWPVGGYGLAAHLPLLRLALGRTYWERKSFSPAVPRHTTTPDPSPETSEFRAAATRHSRTRQLGTTSTAAGAGWPVRRYASNQTHCLPTGPIPQRSSSNRLNTKAIV